jgi:choline dehydrogenase-like flavoprotein
MTSGLTKCFPPEKPFVAKAAPRKKRVLIIGGGFAGISTARALERSDVEIMLIDLRNHHIFSLFCSRLRPRFWHRPILRRRSGSSRRSSKTSA